jgi:hypothetical protein
MHFDVLAGWSPDWPAGGRALWTIAHEIRSGEWSPVTGTFSWATQRALYSFDRYSVPSMLLVGWAHCPFSDARPT